MTVFSADTLGKFEDAAASVPLRPLNRAFESVGIGLGPDPGGVDGARKMQFRRYVASIDQRDAQQVARLGAALGALIGEVATSKHDYLIAAAERDGFTFAGGVFSAASKRGRAKAKAQPDAHERALLDAACRTILRVTGAAAPPASAALETVAAAAAKALGAL